MAEVHEGADEGTNFVEEMRKKQPYGCLAVFYASWHAPSVQLTKVAQGLAAQYSHISILTIDVDKNKKFCAQVGGVETVPTSKFLSPHGQVVDTVVGASPPLVVDMVAKHHGTQFEAPATTTTNGSTPSAAGATISTDEKKQPLEERLKELVNFAPVMVFMKGAKQNPFCKFSKVAVAILNEYEHSEYASFDIFEDQEVREGLKTYSNWPTFPQIYINGELIGGVDILKEMHEDGSLREALPNKKSSASAAATTLEDRLKALVSKAPLMLFMKGTRERPECGFSSKTIQILNEAGVTYETFNILEDPEVREGLKKFSNWPTYPQLYSNGSLIGGVDIIKELHDSGELLQELESM